MRIKQWERLYIAQSVDSVRSQSRKGLIDTRPNSTRKPFVYKTHLEESENNHVSHDHSENESF